MGGRLSDTAGTDFTNPFEYNPATNAWLAPLALMDGRYVRFGMQLNF